jgi:CRP-like cAMP-binding protein
VGRTHAVTDRLWFLRRTGLIERLSGSDRERLARLSETRQYRRGQPVSLFDARAERIHVVVAGRLKISTCPAPGEETVAAMLGPGDLFGEFARTRPCGPVRAEALDRAVVCSVRRAVFEEIIRNTPQAALHAAGVLARRLFAAEREIARLAPGAVPARLARLLLLTKEYGERRECRGSERVAFAFTNEDLARVTGAARETVADIMNQWRDDGVIAIQRGTLVVRDHERLSAVAQSA